MVLVVDLTRRVRETSCQPLVDPLVWRGLSERTFILGFQPDRLDLDRGAHFERGVAASGVVELQVVMDAGRELDPCLPAPAVEQLDLHATPEALHHRVVRGGPELPLTGRSPPCGAAR